MKPYLRRAAAAAVVWLVIPGMALASTHTVRSGDSLWGIANEYHVSVTALEQANHLHNSTIKVGQKLQVPGKVSSHTATTSKQTSRTVSSSRTVTVAAGDTVWSIAHKNGVSVQSIEQLNGLKSTSVIHVGQKLKVASGRISGRSESSIGNLADAALGVEIVSYAKQFQGTPYRWGGTSPAGFDCSGFAQYVLAHFQISVPRTSYGQAQAGVAASTSRPDIGDLVFFNTDGPGASHTGIYVGNGQFINAEDSGVRIDSLWSGYWGSHYIGARHVR